MSNLDNLKELKKKGEQETKLFMSRPSNSVQCNEYLLTYCIENFCPILAISKLDGKVFDEVKLPELGEVFDIMEANQITTCEFPSRGFTRMISWPFGYGRDEQ